MLRCAVLLALVSLPRPAPSAAAQATLREERGCFALAWRLAAHPAPPGAAFNAPPVPGACVTLRRLIRQHCERRPQEVLAEFVADRVLPAMWEQQLQEEEGEAEGQGG